MDNFLVPLAFLAAIAGLVTLGVGLNVLMKWANHRFADTGDIAERLVSMDQRVADLEERVDFAERALTDVRSQRRLESGHAESR